MSKLQVPDGLTSATPYLSMTTAPRLGPHYPSSKFLWWLLRWPLCSSVSFLQSILCTVGSFLFCKYGSLMSLSLCFCLNSLAKHSRSLTAQLQPTLLRFKPLYAISALSSSQTKAHTICSLTILRLSYSLEFFSHFCPPGTPFASIFARWHSISMQGWDKNHLFCPSQN